MISVLHLDLGAGPELSLGGLPLMRRPAQHRLGPTPAPGWVHPYAGPAGLAVFYNDGGQPPATPPATAPSPADLANRPSQQQPPAPAGPQPLIDRETGVAMTQDRFNRIMTRQFEKSRSAAFRELAESLGLPYDPDSFSPDSFKATLREGQDARQQLLTDEQRRSADLDSREQALVAREAKIRQDEEAAAARDRSTRIRSALVSLGATGDDLDDAAALLRVADDADDTAIREAAEALKARRTELFGGVTPQALPPAPSGGPAAGGPPRPPVAGKDAIRQSAIARAEQMGLRPTG